MVAETGVEPVSSGYEPGVLPLHYSATKYYFRRRGEVETAYTHL